MPISDFPPALQPIIQRNFLARGFQKGLRSKLGFRAIADRETIPNGIGESVTKTRAGLKPAVTTPTNPDRLDEMDNGQVETSWGIEQYSLSMGLYQSGQSLNTVTSKVGIGDQFVHMAYANGEQAARSMDTLARDALYSVYLGGNTRVRADSITTSVAVDDVRGFRRVFVNGVLTDVSPANPMAVTIGADLASVVGVAVDTTNVSTTPGGISGVLTLAANASAVAGEPVVAATAPTIIRAAGRATSADILAGDRLTMALLLDAKEKLELNNVPTVDGFYHCYLDAGSSRQLFADPDFRQLFQGATAESAAFRAGEIKDPFLGLRFLPSTNTVVQDRPGFKVRRPIVVGAGALVEGTFEGMVQSDIAPKNAEIQVIDGVAMVTRAPLDRLQMNITQSWYWIGGYAAPSDSLTNPTVVATATNAAFKRAVVIEHAG